MKRPSIILKNLLNKFTSQLTRAVESATYGIEDYLMKRYTARNYTKKREAIMASIQVGDLISYCPNDMSEKYHDYGIVIDISEKYRIDARKLVVYDYTIAWQKDKRVVPYTSTHIVSAIIEKKMILFKNDKERTNL